MIQLLSKNHHNNIILWLKEWKIAIILVANSLLFLTLFYFDMHKSAEFGNREIIGDIDFKYNTVKRKFEHDVIWSDLDLNSIISFRDSILTESNSNAVIKLKDGTEIHLEPDSMIILDISDNYKKIEFSNGSMNIIKQSNSTSPNELLTVETENGSLEFKNADVVLAKKGNKDLSVGVARGDVYANISGEEYNLKKNQSLEFNGSNSSINQKNIIFPNPVQSARNRELAVQDNFVKKMEAISQADLDSKISDPTNNLNLSTSQTTELNSNLDKTKSNTNLQSNSNSSNSPNANTKSTLNTQPASTQNTTANPTTSNTLANPDVKKLNKVRVRKGKYDALDEK